MGLSHTVVLDVVCVSLVIDNAPVTVRLMSLPPWHRLPHNGRVSKPCEVARPVSLQDGILRSRVKSVKEVLLVVTLCSSMTCLYTVGQSVEHQKQSVRPRR